MVYGEWSPLGAYGMAKRSDVPAAGTRRLVAEQEREEAASLGTVVVPDRPDCWAVGEFLVKNLEVATAAAIQLGELFKALLCENCGIKVRSVLQAKRVWADLQCSGNLIALRTWVVADSEHAIEQRRVTRNGDACLAAGDRLGTLKAKAPDVAPGADRSTSECRTVSVGAFQPFAMYQLGKGVYLRSTGIMVYDFESNDYTIPIGFGIGKVIPQGSTVYNAFIEPQVSIADRGDLWPSWQIFVGFNMQFMGR